MSESITNPLEYYPAHGPITDPGEGAALFKKLPTDVRELCEIVQGQILHLHWVERYGVEVTEEGQKEANLRFVSKQLERIMASADTPLSKSRPVEERIMGTCRDFSTFLCALLRSQGRPARARCGFGAYFTPGQYEDHWICEYWKADENRWVMVDAQLDEFQCKELGVTFDPRDVPADQFIIAGKAWQSCRSGQADQDQFGIFDMHGWWFIQGNLIRDLASLNKVELLPWDVWGCMRAEDQDLSKEDMELMDRAAALTLSDNSAFSEVRSFYLNDDRLKVPSIITSHTDTGTLSVDLKF
jgi:hypothetical protein